MARTGRPKAVTARVEAHIGLFPLHAKVFDLLDFDPFTGKRQYGARNAHLDKALAEYFEKYYPHLVKKLLTGDI